MNTDNPEKPPFSVHAMTESGIDQSDIWKGDCFNRSGITRKLTKLALDEGMQEGGRRGYVISINGGWGTGKTFMLTRWHKELQEKNRVAIYFDAWQNDFIANPLVAIIGQLQDMLEQIDVQKMKLDQEMKDRFLRLAKNISFNLSLGVGSVNIPIGELAKPSENDIVKRYHDERKEIKELRDSLEKLVMEIRKSIKFPLVFIIDELDRCRPTFAIEVLERVKHLFNLPGVVFVFGVNKSQLEKSVRSVYGEIDADEYLQKFFNLDLSLPVAKPSEYCKSLLNDKIHHEEVRIVFDNFYLPMLNYMSLSLRQVEYSAQLFKLGFLTEKPQGLFGYSIACLVLLKTIDLDLYSQFIHGKCRCKDVINKMAASWIMGDFSEEYKPGCQYYLQCGIYQFAMSKEREDIIKYLMKTANDKDYDTLITKETKLGIYNPQYNLLPDVSYEEFVANITKGESEKRKKSLKRHFQRMPSVDQEWIRKVVGLLDLVEYKD